MITFQAFFKNQGDASKIEVLRMLNWRPKQIFVLRTFLAKTLEECNIYECYSILYCSFYGAATNYYHTIFILNSFTLIFFCTILKSMHTFSSFNQFFNKNLYYLVARFYAFYEYIKCTFSVKSQHSEKFVRTLFLGFRPFDCKISVKSIH